ncbi:VanW family protein [Clostridium thermarum]|uniref:VanW family protein n=1 Tax=Clostridium thermarum TaxID=1716543 RepID=UPI0013D60C4B|nr:VanW family protein [Clostridium thermarum]
MKKKKKKTKRNFVIILSVFAVLALSGGAAYTGYVYKINSAWNNFIYPGVKIMGIEVGGKTKTEAIALLKERYGDVVVKKKINIKYLDKTYSIGYDELNARYNIEEIVEEVFSYGKDLSIFQKNNTIKNGINKEYELSFTYDDTAVGSVIAAMEKDINKDPVDGSLEMVSRGKFKVTPDIKGYKLLSDKLKEDIINSINGDLGNDITIEAPVETLTAHKTEEKLSTVDTLIASYSTDYKTSSWGRSTNIELATKSIDKLLLMPGDSFSFNETVGERTKARGYQEAGVIIGNKIESGLGGGICQVSSTLYNAVLRANINSTERYHHTLTSSYVAYGLDATVDWGNLDYKFTNTLEYPIYIEGYVQNKTVHFNIYSNKSLTSRQYDVVNQVYKTVETTTKTIEDPNMPEGKKEVVQKAQTGIKVRVYRNTYENGKLIKQDLISDDYYRPVEGIVKVGTKKVETAVKLETTNNQAATSPQNTAPATTKPESSEPESNPSETSEQETTIPENTNPQESNI